MSLFRKSLYCSFFFAGLLVRLCSCYEEQQKKSLPVNEASSIQIEIADSNHYPLASRDHRIYNLQKEWCKKLSLYELRKGTDSFELRLWQLKGDHIPIALDILKWYKGGWTQYRYAFFQQPYKKGQAEQGIDSFSVHTSDQRNNNWGPYLDSLDIRSMWLLPSQCELPGNYEGVPGEAFAAELADKKKYKFLYYADPASFVLEKNNRLITNFIRHFTAIP